MKSVREENAKLMAEANSLFEQLNDAWCKSEESIRSFGVLKPVHISVEMPCGNGFLGVEKLQGKWRICFGTSNGDDIAWCPVSDTSVEYRILLLPKVEPLLYPAIVEGNKEVVAHLKKAIHGDLT